MICQDKEIINAVKTNGLNFRNKTHFNIYSNSCIFKALLICEDINDYINDKIDLNCCGIYAIYKDNELIYIGSSIHIFERITCHFYDNIAGKINKNDYDKYSWRILEKCCINDLLKKEENYIRLYKPLLNNYYK